MKFISKNDDSVGENNPLPPFEKCSVAKYE